MLRRCAIWKGLVKRIMFESPFMYFIFLSWSGFAGAAVVYVVTFFACHFKQYVEKW